jgi:hypothetical protein
MKAIDSFPKVRIPNGEEIYVCDESLSLIRELLNF